jgi:hypothetical protein
MYIIYRSDSIPISTSVTIAYLLRIRILGALELALDNLMPTIYLFVFTEFVIVVS